MTEASQDVDGRVKPGHDEYWYRLVLFQYLTVIAVSGRHGRVESGHDSGACFETALRAASA
jgi:hypothetical protein